MSADPVELQREVEAFLFAEARMLDEGRLDEWLALFTDDAHYVIPIRHTFAEGDGFLPVGDVQVMHMDEDRAGLAQRIARLATGHAHAETPRSRTRHFVTNVEVEAKPGRSEVSVRSNVLLFQGRRDTSEELFSAARRDILRPHAAGWHIASRTVLLDHTVLRRALSVLF